MVQPHHRFSIAPLFKLPATRIIAQFWLQSGARYTPLVAGDINGDGQSNDAAFVFNPATTPDAALRDGLAALLEQAPQAARRCVTTQYGRIAARNSCTGPWTGSLDVRIEFAPHWLFPHEGGMTIDVINAAGGFDALLHGSAHRHGWGDPYIVDPTLLVANGFDPATRQFRYQVNPRFGQRAAFGSAHASTEIRATISVPVGSSLTTQQNRTAATKLRANKDDPEALRRGWRIFNPFAAVLKYGSTIQLTDAQVDSIDVVEHQWLVIVDSLQQQLTDYVMHAADTVSDNALAEHVRDVSKDIATITQNWAPALKLILTEDQRDLLPHWLQMWITGRQADPLGPVQTM
jgi:hypothetical protein